MDSRNLTIPLPLMALGLGIALSASFGTGGGAAELPKEGTFTTTFTVIGSDNKTMETMAGRHAWTGETFNLQMNYAGQGFFHKMTGHCLYAGGHTNADGGVRNSGQCQYSDADGDTFYVTFEGGRERKGDTTKNTYKIVAGIGKYAGIQGQYEATVDWLKFPIETVDYGIGHYKGSYKIVPVTQ
jgi:hypothetical protein